MREATLMKRLQELGPCGLDEMDEETATAFVEYEFGPMVRQHRATEQKEIVLAAVKQALAEQKPKANGIQPKNMRLRDAAKYAGVSSATLRREYFRGNIAVVRRPGSKTSPILVPVDSIDHWIATRRQQFEAVP